MAGALSAELVWWFIVLAPALAGLAVGLELWNRGRPAVSWIAGLAVWLGGAWLLLFLALEDPGLGWRIAKYLG